MHCRANTLSDHKTRDDFQARVEAVLAPYANNIEYFGLSKPKDGWMVVEVVYTNKSGPDSLITIPDESVPHLEDRILSGLRRS